MPNDNFRFKAFTIEQNRTAMKVGTDGVLLGAWATDMWIANASTPSPRVLDVGTGTGLIALMAAQKIPDASIVAIDIDTVAIEQARHNILASPWNDRVEVLPTSLQDFTTHHKFHLILSNPPYFINSQKCPDAQRTLARHADSLPLSTLMKCATTLLTADGCLAIVLPAEAQKEADKWAAIYGLFLNRCVNIKTKNSKPVKRCLLAYRQTPPQSVSIETRTLLSTDNNRSEWYNALTDDFYL